MKNIIHTTAGGMTGYKQIEFDALNEAAEVSAFNKGFLFLANYFAKTGISPRNSPFKIKLCKSRDNVTEIASYKDDKDMTAMINLTNKCKRKQLDQAINSLR